MDKYTYDRVDRLSDTVTHLTARVLRLEAAPAGQIERRKEVREWYFFRWPDPTPILHRRRKEDERRKLLSRQWFTNSCGDVDFLRRRKGDERRDSSGYPYSSSSDPRIRALERRSV